MSELRRKKMARSLYRFYLYAIFIALLIFAVVVTAQLLNTLFSFIPLLRGGSAGSPDQAALVQSLVFAIVGWLIAGSLGGLHYWLIRRDLNSDPSAGGSAIRSFFLNATEAAGVLTLVPLIGFSIIGNWAYNNGGSVTSSAGVALPTLAMVLLLELERRRFQARTGAALVFQRLHFFGVQLSLLSLMAGSILSALRPLVDGLFFGGQGACSDYYCPSYNLFGLAVEMLWFIACWLVYGLVTSQDSSRIVRMLLHGASLAFGISYVLYGVYLALELILLPLLKLPVAPKDVVGLNASYDFFSPLLLGLIVTTVYHLLLRDVSRREFIDQQVRRLTEWTIAALLLAGIFWYGCGYALYNFLQAVAPSPTGPDGHAWVETLALVIAGLSYIPLSLFLRRRYALDPATSMGPRRGLVLALLGMGILAFAIGGA